MTNRILEGIRIVEFGWAVVGPLTTSWAGNYGAEVIKIETNTRPDIIRSMTPFINDEKDIDKSLFFGRENSSKYSMALNLRHPDGIQLAKKIIEKSDIVLDSYTSGVMDKYSLGYEDLKKIKPDIIMLSSCMYGQTGALRKMPGYGVPLTAISGISYLCGWPDRAPTGPYGSYTDYLVPRFNLLALIGALDYRRRTGEGVYIDASQLESSVQFVAPLILDYGVNQRIGHCDGNSSPIAVPHSVFPCSGKERWCAIAVFNAEEWTGFCDALEAPPWSREARFSSFEGRKENEGDLNKLIAEWTRTRSAREVMEIMQAHGVAAGVVNNGEDLANDPHLAHNGYYSELEHPKMGSISYPAHSIEFSNCEQKVKRSPCLGEHTEQICKEVIGLSDREFETLFEAGVFE